MHEEVVFDEIINPGVDIHHEAALIHGITPEMCEGKLPDHLATKVVYDWIVRQEETVALATHNGTGFDLPIFFRLAAEGDRLGRPPLRLPHIDTLTCAVRCMPNAPNHKLSFTPEDEEQLKETMGARYKPKGPGLIQQLGLGTGEGAHDARADTRMVMALVDHFAFGLQGKIDCAGNVYEALANWCATPHVLTHCHFGKHSGKPWGTEKGCVPSYYVREWILDKWEDATPDMIATMKYHYGRTFSYIKRGMHA